VKKYWIMKNLFNVCAIALMTASCFSCNNSGQADSTKDAKDSNTVKMDSSGGSATSGSIPATVSKEDAQFVVNTANAGMTEVQLGQIAQQKGMAKDVKDYGVMMVTDHTAAGDQLKTLATSKNITLPAAISPDMQKNVDAFQNKSGKDFDKDYISMMIDDHKKVIADFEAESKNGTDADIRAFADKTLPTLRMHLSKAEECRKMMKKM
jgi:putative membrane protein